MNCWPSGKYVHLLYMYSILGRGSFCFNYGLNSAWHGGDQFVTLLRWYGSPGFFDSGLQVIFIFWSFVSHFLLTIPHIFSMGFRSGEFAGQSSTPTPWSFNPQCSVVEHCVSSTKVVGSIPRECTYWKKKCIALMYFKSLWIKASAKCRLLFCPDLTIAMLSWQVFQPVPSNLYN